MKSIFFLLSILVSLQLMAQDGSAKAYDEVSRKIGTGDCGGAEATARANFQAPMIYTVLGFIQLECKKNKKSAVDYFTISARENESLAIEKLISLGEAPPPLSRNSQNPSVYATPLPAPPPMPAIIQPQPPRIIILPQVQVQPMMNPNACIQDGGPIFCPNYNRRR
jgi:hypothetical protein